MVSTCQEATAVVHLSVATMPTLTLDLAHVAKPCSQAYEVDRIRPTWPVPCFGHKRVSSTVALQHDVFCTRLTSFLVGAKGELDPASYAEERASQTADGYE